MEGTQLPSELWSYGHGRQIGKSWLGDYARAVSLGRGAVFFDHKFLGHVEMFTDHALDLIGMDFGLTEARIIAQLGKAKVDKAFWDKLRAKASQNTENHK